MKWLRAASGQAHSVSWGLEGKRHRPGTLRKKRFLLSPLRGSAIIVSFPWLTPWATLYRHSVAEKLIKL